VSTGHGSRRALTRAGWGLAAFGLLGLALPLGIAQGAPVATGACADGEEAQFLDLVNAYRAENGLGPLTLSQSLSNASEYHSIDMAEKGYFAHTMPDGTTVERNVRNHGYRGETFGENIVAGTETAEEALKAWKESPSHNENMLRGAFKTVGIGRHYTEGSPYGWYWTTTFGGTVDREGAYCDQNWPAAPSDDSGAVSAPAEGGDNERNGRSRKRATTNDPDVNLRTGPGRTYPVIEVVGEGEEFVIVGEPESGYLPVSYLGKEAWVAQEWVDVVEPAPATDGEVIETAQTAAPEPAPAPVTVIETVNLRAEPSQEGAVLTMITSGDPIELTGVSENGYLGATYNGSNGWVDADYVQVPANRSAEPAAEAAAAEFAGAEVVATDTLNLRAGPSRAAEIVEVVPAGTALVLNGQRDDGYFGIDREGLDLWADAAYLR
jgi:uncharacterized protein YraI